MELVLFYISSAVALFATIFALTRTNAAHALIYLIVSLLAVAVIFFLLGAPFAAALEIVIYAGAIMVLFVFVIMMLNLGEEGEERERQRMHPAVWIGPSLLSAILLIEMILMLSQLDDRHTGALITAKQVGLTLFGPYVLAVEIASMLLLAGLVGAYHVGRRFRLSEPDNSSPSSTEGDS
ncbi:MAG: NADH-quinone oxidoreductase subunit J [Gammaproteobacteria bacterium]|nr:NADH-quinone oxidoreductase subunit J [Gammaproteobacteria bacterium]